MYGWGGICGLHVVFYCAKRFGFKPQMGQHKKKKIVVESEFSLFYVCPCDTGLMLNAGVIFKKIALQ